MLEDPGIFLLSRNVSNSNFANTLPVAYPSTVNKLIIYPIRLHLLPYNIPDSTQNGIHGRHLTIPGDERGDTFTIDASGLGTSVGI